MSTADAGDRFLAFVIDMHRNFEISPFAKSQSVSEWAQHLIAELAEFEDARATPGAGSDADAELGDVIWNVICLAIAHERAGGRPLTLILEDARVKFRLRKPWIFDGTGAPATADEERALFKARKAELNGRVR